MNMDIERVGLSSFGTDIFAISLNQAEMQRLARMSNKVRDSKKLWATVLPTVNQDDKRLYRILYGCDYPPCRSPEAVFKLGLCFKNALFGAWLANGRTLESIKYEVCWSKWKHAALIDKFTYRIVDPTFEFLPAATNSRQNWKVETIIGLCNESKNSRINRFGFPVNSLKELKSVFGGEYLAFLEEAERIACI